MAPESAFVALLLGIGGIAYLWINRERLRESTHCSWLFGGYSLMLLGAVGASAGTAVGGSLVDLLAPAAFAASTLVLCNWCRLAASALRNGRL